MRWFVNMKTINKLLLVFVLISAFIIAVGLVGRHYMGQIVDNMNYMYDKNLLPIQDLGQASRSMEAIRGDLWQVAARPSPPEIKSAFADIDENFAVIDKVLDEYGRDGSLLTPQDREYYRATVENVSAYRSNVDRFKIYVNGAQKDGGQAFSEKELTASRIAAQQAMQKLVDFNRQQAEEKMQSSRDDFNKANQNMLLILIITCSG